MKQRKALPPETHWEAETIDFATAADFLDYLCPHKAHWIEHVTDRWVWRGHADASWELLPAAHRKRTPSVLAAWIDGFCRPPELGNSESAKISREAYALHMFAAENHVVYRFANVANQLGIPLPKDDYVPLTFDVCRIDPGRTGWWNICAGMPPIPQVFALAQHHGIPTRLIDWTTSPFTAAFFATEPVTVQPSHFCVWALNLTRLEPQMNIKIMPLHRSFNQFALKQEGVLMFDAEASKMYIRNGNYRTIDSIVSNVGWRVTSPIRLVRLPSSEATALRRLLWQYRVSKAHLMPTLDCVAKTALEFCMWDHEPNPLDETAKLLRRRVPSKQRKPQSH